MSKYPGMRAGHVRTQIREIAERVDNQLNFLITSLIGDPLTDITPIQRPHFPCYFVLQIFPPHPSKPVGKRSQILGLFEVKMSTCIFSNKKYFFL